MTSHADVSDEDLGHQIHDLEAERDALRRSRKAYRADGHAAVDRSVAAAKATVDGIMWDSLHQLAHSAGEPIRLAGLADAFVLASFPEVAKRWHAIVDAPVPSDRSDHFGSMDRPEYERRVADLSASIAARERELRVRAMTKARAQLDAQLEAEAKGA